ncbi:MAG: hypothetical protein R6V35_04895 [Candidatus Nanohaloarchaea archaeon]
MAPKDVDSIKRFGERWDKNIEEIKEKDLDRKACKNIYSDFLDDAEDLLIFSNRSDRAIEAIKDHKSRLTIELDSSRIDHKLYLLNILSKIKLEIILIKNKFF